MFICLVFICLLFNCLIFICLKIFCSSILYSFYLKYSNVLYLICLIIFICLILMYYSYALLIFLLSFSVWVAVLSSEIIYLLYITILLQKNERTFFLFSTELFHLILILPEDPKYQYSASISLIIPKHYIIWIYTLLVCLSVCLFVSNKRQNSWTDQAQILCVRPHMILGTKISKISIQQNSIFLNFENPRIFLCKIPELYLLLFYNVYKKIKMFTIELKDGLEAP